MTITHCRLCGSTDLQSILNLGNMALTGRFPPPGVTVPSAPLEPVRCLGECGLVQLRDSFSQAEMFCADYYGYRSSLNTLMVDHLRDKARQLSEAFLNPGDLVLDIGSNDGTFLRQLPGDTRRWGVDPGRFAAYGEGIGHIRDFFSAAVVRARLGQQAKLVTSLAMFYDLEDPLAFARDVASILAPDGVWHFEQAYLPAMLARTSYDSICHEHLEYYALRQVQWVLDRCGMRIADVSFNDINGGSFAVTACLIDSSWVATPAVGAALAAEHAMDLEDGHEFTTFARRVGEFRHDLWVLLNELAESGKKVVGYGASTKGNVILQACGLTTRELACIAEVNSDKFGAVTPGTGIPIVSEAAAKALKPDYMLVLPWAFRDNILAREREYLLAGGKLIFPLPTLEIVRGFA